MAVRPNINPNRKFCRTYWCYCDWYDECQENKRRAKAGEAGCGPDPDHAAERIGDEERRKEDARRKPPAWYEDDCGAEEGKSDDRGQPGQPDKECWQTHVHEFEGSTKLFEKGLERHNHRIAGVTGEAIAVKGGHVHKVWTRTDFFDHYHVVTKLTGPAIPVGKHGKDGKHIHYVEGATSVELCHDHQFEFATQIESPLLPLEEDKRK